MLEIGFLELVVIFGVALVVLGPTRLPGLVRQIGRWVGKARSMARQFREQLESEVNIEELNRMTEKRAREASASTPPPPAGVNGEPLPDAPEAAPKPSGDDNLAASGYPYSAPEPAASASPAATDDTYSHAHAEGGAPMPDHAEATADDVDGSTPERSA